LTGPGTDARVPRSRRVSMLGDETPAEAMNAVLKERVEQA
jgi:hypothetical protein